MEFWDLTVRTGKSDYSPNAVICLDQTIYDYAKQDVDDGTIYLPPEQAILVAKEMIKQANILIRAKKVDS